MEGNRKIKSIKEYPASGLGFMAASILKIIKLMKERIPPKPGFQFANRIAKSPIPHTINRIIVYTLNEALGLLIPSIKEPMKKIK